MPKSAVRKAHRTATKRPHVKHRAKPIHRSRKHEEMPAEETHGYSNR